MKITRYAMMLAAATGLLSACQKLDEVKAYDPDKVVAPVLHALPGEIVITPDNMGSTQTFTWDAADFGVRVVGLKVQYPPTSASAPRSTTRSKPRTTTVRNWCSSRE